ncbi:restriction endonuclease subunit S [Sphingomonas sp.]|uniref:restriction endonuclease subunit S n=1 Tax=Sphingomonas sp. TaxID=28214 RepID=UPI002BF51A31|nr:restriction endonuclease subunit S [Sphingomonas sp.]HWK35166.1 restriction endonuclease subunit S [Sphingomonas sp.]
MNHLPHGWAETTLDDLAEINPGRLGDVAADTHISFVPMPAVSDTEGEIVSPSIRPFAEVSKGYTQFRDGDVIFAKITPCMENGKIAVARGLENGMACGSTEFHVVRPLGDISPDFIWRYLRQKSFRNDAEALMTGAVGQRRVPANFLKEQTFALPPLPEQRRIVAKIDSLTGKSKRARDHLDHIPRLVEKYKQAVLAAAFRGDLTRDWREQNRSASWSNNELASLKAQREAYLNARRGSRLHVNRAVGALPVPTGWFDAQLADVGRLQVGYAYKSKWYAPDGVRLLRGANIAPGKITWDDEARLPVELAEEYRAYSLDAGDIVIAMDRPVISSGLKVARIEAQDAGCLLVQRVARYAPSELVEPDYVWHLINSQHFIEHAVTQATGSDLPHISSNDILTTPIPLPCLAEQREIARRVTVAFSWIDRLAADATSARKLIDHLDQTILAKAFQGELVPQDPADEPATILLERIRAERTAAPKPKRGRRKAA